MIILRRKSIRRVNSRYTKSVYDITNHSSLYNYKVDDISGCHHIETLFNHTKFITKYSRVLNTHHYNSYFEPKRFKLKNKYEDNNISLESITAVYDIRL